ncbi:MAG: hypothetical protein LBJ90_08255, partial [Treponema sp.]|nr:hypothetical protein [Treponema sp.]
MRKIIRPLSLLLFFSFLQLSAGTRADEAFPGEIPGESLPEGEILPEGDGPPRRPARWFRSNSAGMALEEIPSRLAAMRGEYALVIDYFEPGELPPVLSPFLKSGFLIEGRILYHGEQISRRQWIFRDRMGLTRLVSVFREISADDDASAAAGVSDNASDNISVENAPDDGASANGESTDDGSTDDGSAGGGITENSSAPTGRAPAGFIEIYNENSLITEEHLFFDDGEETFTGYFYRRNALIRAEVKKKTVNEEGGEAFVDVYTDNYRYNRSASLRAVERVYHEEAEISPVRLTFPNRILDAAAEDSFIDVGLAQGSEFFGDSIIRSGYRLVSTVDERGRILTQTLLDDRDGEVWVIKNSWSGERIVSSLRTEGEDERLTEYEYNAAGDRILERNSRNGVLERLVRAEGGRETEDLYI